MQWYSYPTPQLFRTGMLNNAISISPMSKLSKYCCFCFVVPEIKDEEVTLRSVKESPSPPTYIESILGGDQEETKENSAMRDFLKEK